MLAAGCVGRRAGAVGSRLARAYGAGSSVRSTTLDSGLVVNTVDTQGPLASVELVVEAGTRHETYASAGSSYYLERLATLSTPRRSQVRLIHDIESTLGFQVQRGHESTTIATRALREDAASAVELVLDTTRPSCLEYEIRDVAKVIAADAQARLACPVTRVTDAIHQTAYRSHALGRPKYGLPHAALDQATVMGYLYAHWTAPRASLWVTNMDHDAAVAAATGAAGFANVVDGLAGSPVDSPAVYSGGESRTERDGDTYVALAFEGVPRGHQHAAAQQVLKHVVRQVVLAPTVASGVAKNGEAHAVPYSDSGLIGVLIRAGGPGSDAVGALAQAFRQVRSVDPAAFSSALNAAITEASTESTSFAQGAAHPSPDSIRAVTHEEVRALADATLRSNLTLVVDGNVEAVPNPRDVQAVFT